MPQATKEQSQQVRQRSWISFIVFLAIMGVWIPTEFLLYAIWPHAGMIGWFVFLPFAITYLAVLLRYWRCPVCNVSFFSSGGDTRRCKHCDTSFSI